MPARKPKVIVTRRLPDSIEIRMRELFDVELNLNDKPLTQDELKAAVARADVLAPTITDRIDAEVIAAAGPKLKLIANYGAGLNHLDVAAANAKGITVTNTPGVLTEDTADLAMTLLMAASRRVVEGVKMIEAQEYKGWAPTGMLGRRISGKRLGIIGMGRIGQALAKRAQAFNMQVHYHNRKPLSPAIAEALGATWWENLDEMLARMDFIAISTPLTPATHHLISAERLTRMQPHAILINTARGEVIDEAALADALAAGRLGGAGLDVYEREPEVHPQLLTLPNVVLLPHLGSATVESRTEMGEKVIVNIRAFLDGHRPPDRVIPTML
ncbi:MAG: D-glycerate dehydrogenase [Caulobacterales bacterium 68-7]|nr:MAG: D-glycerate dehydrogenase [Caulobacterales bacterium 68-7]